MVLAECLKAYRLFFFAYIGFDAISTTAEECKNPQKDLPKSMMYAIVICTVLYILISLVLTGMVPYNELAVGDPLAYVFEKLNIGWMIGIVGLSAVVAMASVFLVFQLGQPRIWMSMSRDGLLPKAFSRIHPKYQTPGFATIVTGLVVAVPALFLNMTFVTDMVSIGTLFAFVLVCGGVLKLQTDPNAPRGKFKTPYFNAKYVMPLLFIFGCTAAFTWFKTDTMQFITNEKKMYDPSSFVSSLNQKQISDVTYQISLAQPNEMAGRDLLTYLESLDANVYMKQIASLNLNPNLKYESGWQLFKHKIPTWIFIVITIALTVLAIKYQLSLIPLLGLECCLYMMSELGYKNWLYFGAWLLIGLLIYFGYSYKNSKLELKTT